MNDNNDLVKESERERQDRSNKASTKPIREINDEDNGSHTERPTPANERHKTRPVETG